MDQRKSKDMFEPKYHIIIKTRKLTLLHYFQLVAYPSHVLAIVPVICFTVKKSSQGPHVAFSCHFSLISFNIESQLSLTFMTFRDQLFGRILLNVGTSDVSSLFDLDFVYMAGISQKHRRKDVFFLLHHIK